MSAEAPSASERASGEVGIDRLIDCIRRRKEADGAARLAELDLQGANLAGADLSELDLSRLDLRGADLSSADLSRSNLSGAKLTGAKLSGAQLTGAELVGADLSDANLNGCTAERAGFGAANLTGAHLFEANLSETALSHARLGDADLRCADLTRARVHEADLSGADFSHAVLRETELDRSSVSSATFDACDLRGARLAALSSYEDASWIDVDIRETDFRGAYTLRRLIVDENYLHEFRTRGRASEVLYRMWWVTSDCGRSFGRWALWTALVVLLFAAAFQQVSLDYGQHPTFISHLYFSVVTLTTLGYGDVQPASVAAQILAMCEVFVGYVALGGLISILANKMARRGE